MGVVLPASAVLGWERGWLRDRGELLRFVGRRPSFRFRERPCLKGVREKVTEQDTRTSSHTYNK